MELIEDNPIVEAALKSAQRFREEMERVWTRLCNQGKNPAQAKAYAQAEAAEEAAMVVLANVLAAAGADVLGYGNKPSQEAAGRYLTEWNTCQNSEGHEQGH